MKYEINSYLLLNESPEVLKALGLFHHLLFGGHDHFTLSYNGYELRLCIYSDTPEDVEEIHELARKYLDWQWEINDGHATNADGLFYWTNFDYRIEQD